MTCCVTGHRPARFPFLREIEDLSYQKYLAELYSNIRICIQEGYHHFMTGMAEGADLDFANYVLDFQKSNPALILEAALPYPIRKNKTVTTYQRDRDRILSLCNQQSIISERYYQGCMQKRNRYMVDCSDLVLAIWNGEKKGGTWNTIQYARSKEKVIRYIMLTELLEK